MSKQLPPAPTASAVGPCPTVIQIVGRLGTGRLPSTIAPPDHPKDISLNSGMEFTCEICGASLSNNTSLQRHIRAQHQDLKHLCQFCDKAFRYVTAKTRHEKHCSVNNKQPANQIYMCGKCNKKFKKKHYLDVHTQAPTLGYYLPL